MLKILILCGGQSTRMGAMGADKGSFNFNSSSWVEIVVSKVREIFSETEILLSVNSQQLPIYKQYLKPNVNLVGDTSIAAGPLRGILSAHYNYNEVDFMVFTCDMLNLNKEVIEMLLVAYKTHPEVDLIHFNLNQQWLPFPCVIRHNKLKNLGIYYQNQSNYSMKHFVQNCTSFKIDLSENFASSFVNINSPEDLKQLGRKSKDFR